MSLRQYPLVKETTLSLILTLNVQSHNMQLLGVDKVQCCPFKILSVGGQIDQTYFKFPSSIWIQQHLQHQTPQLVRSYQNSNSTHLLHLIRTYMQASTQPQLCVCSCPYFCVSYMPDCILPSLTSSSDLHHLHQRSSGSVSVLFSLLKRRCSLSGGFFYSSDIPFFCVGILLHLFNKHQLSQSYVSLLLIV